MEEVQLRKINDVDHKIIDKMNALVDESKFHKTIEYSVKKTDTIDSIKVTKTWTWIISNAKNSK